MNLLSDHKVGIGILKGIVSVGAENREATYKVMWMRKSAVKVREATHHVATVISITQPFGG